MSKKLDLAWGESRAVRSAFLETGQAHSHFDLNDLHGLGYPDHAGDPALVELTRKVIKRQTGNTYPYILITNGATGAATIAMRSFAKSRQLKHCITNDPPYFRLYPSMVSAAGLYHFYASHFAASQEAIYLVDSLSNPLGKFSEMKKNIFDSPIIWDAVYYGNVYAPGNHPQPQHHVLVGSYSKLTGLNGLRVGWIACHELRGYNIMKQLVAAEYCGISAASTKIIMDTVGKFTDWHWDSFEHNAQNKLDYNRGEFSKLEKFFGGQPVGPYGMFYYVPMDTACKRLFEKSGIIWSPGSQLGTTDDFGRFNIGQDIQLVRKAVATVLKNDKI